MVANVTQFPNGTYLIPYNGRESLFIPTDGLTGFNRDNNTGYGNLTLFANFDQLCNVKICDLTLADFDYIPNLGGNAFFAAVLGLYIIANIFLGFRFKTWGYMGAMVLGLSGEVVGYIGRILIWKNPFDPTGNDFLIYLVPLTISPALLAAAIYLCLSRIIVTYGAHLARFRPGTYTIIFCGCDLFSLVLQALGGGIASGANTNKQTQLGINIMLAGLSCQVVSLVIFAALCLEFAFRLRKNPQNWNPDHMELRRSPRFRAFLYGLAIATLAIFIRSAYRVAELSGGFHGSLANNEVSFMILEGTMIIIATSCLTFLHPGLAFHGSWATANFSFRAKKSVDTEMTPTSQVSEQEEETEAKTRR